MNNVPSLSVVVAVEPAPAVAVLAGLGTGGHRPRVAPAQDDHRVRVAGRAARSGVVRPVRPADLETVRVRILSQKRLRSVFTKVTEQTYLIPPNFAVSRLPPNAYVVVLGVEVVVGGACVVVKGLDSAVPASVVLKAALQ